MNIQNRLKRLENEVIDDSTVCVCFPQYTEVFMQTFDENGAANKLERWGEKLVPEVCRKCNKPTATDKIIVEFIHQIPDTK
jgi:hypothetical protein